MANTLNFTKGYTHSGIFHADDVFSTALLKMLNPDIRIERVPFVPNKLPENSIVYDIGKGKYHTFSFFVFPYGKSTIFLLYLNHLKLSNF